MAHERKRICKALDRRWQNRQQPLVMPATQLKETTTQVQLSSKQIEHERQRIHAPLARWQASSNLAPVTGQALQVTPAQHTLGVRKSMFVHDPTGPHIPSMFAAMVYTAMSHGSEWAKTRVLVDSGIEHLLLISQSMTDKWGLAVPIFGEATQTDGAFLQLRDVGNVDMVFNNKVVSRKFLSAPLSHYDVILGEP